MVVIPVISHQSTLSGVKLRAHAGLKLCLQQIYGLLLHRAETLMVVSRNVCAAQGGEDQGIGESGLEFVQSPAKRRYTVCLAKEWVSRDQAAGY